MIPIYLKIQINGANQEIGLFPYPRELHHIYTLTETLQLLFGSLSGHYHKNQSQSHAILNIRANKSENETTFIKIHCFDKVF